MLVGDSHGLRLDAGALLSVTSRPPQRLSKRLIASLTTLGVVPDGYGRPDGS